MESKKIKLMSIFGKDRVFDDETTLFTYAQDQSFSPKRKPEFVVFAESLEEIQQLVKLSNEMLTPIIPYSSGLNFHGAALPDQGGIILNLSRMNRILQIDEKNWFVVVEPGVTFEQLQGELMDKGFHIMIPFGVPARRSVLTSYLERDPVLAAPSLEHGNFLIMDTELILPDGEIFRTGLWSSGGTPGGFMGPVRNLLYRFWTGAQGTMGIMTKMGIKITPFVKERKLIQRREIGMECFLLNRFNLAALLSEEWKIPESFPAVPQSSESFENLKKLLPPWVMTICIKGSPRRPEGKIAYEEDALREVCNSLNVELKDSLPQMRGCDRVLLDELVNPWGILKKFNYRGSVHDLNFKSPLHRIDYMEELIQKVCDDGDYDRSSIGAYLLPLERGRAVHCEFDLHCNLEDEEETDKVKGLWLKASEVLMNEGAFFDRPYGAWAEMVYQRCEVYARKLKELKAELDPQGILNPGKLCL
ncbi:MAG: FAD-binding oxidoreductase [Deltaproteobacteria bacterium]|nr:FAD-binding oxidoreductase [Deltaproteobacteria bacterium]